MTTTTTAATTPAPAYGPDTNPAGGENVSPAAAGPHAPYATHPNPTKETIPMTNQANPADKVREIVDAMRESMRRAENTCSDVGLLDDMSVYITDLVALLPTPPLPEGWRLADHPSNGRVIVTNTTPNIEGRVYYVLPSADPLGFDWLFCHADELTYIDQGADQ